MPTVLIVEDAENAADALARLIRRAGFQADRAANGEGAVAYLRQIVPDLVVCDLMMPHLDGLGVLRAVRADPRTADLPVLIYSAAGDAAREPALAAGATAFYVKGSLDPEQLIAQMAVLMDRHRPAACG
jgi:CheY-like chemotaxis protein